MCFAPKVRALALAIARVLPPGGLLVIFFNSTMTVHTGSNNSRFSVFRGCPSNAAAPFRWN
jgi:hypothetical protein